MFVNIKDNLLQAITPIEYDMLDWYRRNYSEMDRENSDRTISVKEVLSEVWAESKQELFKLFDNNLIISKEFTYERDFDELIEEIENSVYSSASYGKQGRNGAEFYQSYNNYVYNAYRDKYHSKAHLWKYLPWEEKEKVPEYKEAIKAINLADCLNDLISFDTLANNIYNGGNFTITLPNGKDYVVHNGCKPLRVLSKLAEAWNLPGFEDFRITHSLVHNQKHINGTMYLSIHPLDYWTMSDNECGWESCMSWENNGSYRAGTIEMMNSPWVIVAYLDSDTSARLYMGNNNAWNSKKWRQLFIVNNELILGIKSYPYDNTYISDFVANWLKELAEKNWQVKYLTNENKPFDFSRISKYTITSDSDSDSDTTKFSFSTVTMYCDVGCANYSPFYYSNLVQSKKCNQYNYSGLRQCISCGSIHSSYGGCDGALVCTYCSNLPTCECCGDVIYGEEYEFDGKIICENCWEEHVSSCEACGETCWSDDIVTIKYCAPENFVSALLSQCQYKNNKIVQDKLKQGLTPVVEIYLDNFICEHCYNHFVENYLLNGKDSVKIYKTTWYQDHFVPIEEIKNLEKATNYGGLHFPNWLNNMINEPELFIENHYDKVSSYMHLCWYETENKNKV